MGRRSQLPLHRWPPWPAPPRGSDASANAQNSLRDAESPARRPHVVRQAEGLLYSLALAGCATPRKLPAPARRAQRASRVRFVAMRRRARALDAEIDGLRRRLSGTPEQREEQAGWDLTQGLRAAWGQLQETLMPERAAERRRRRRRAAAAAAAAAGAAARRAAQPGRRRCGSSARRGGSGRRRRRRAARSRRSTLAKPQTSTKLRGQPRRGASPRQSALNTALSVPATPAVAPTAPPRRRRRRPAAPAQRRRPRPARRAAEPPPSPPPRPPRAPPPRPPPRRRRRRRRGAELAAAAVAGHAQRVAARVAQRRGDGMGSAAAARRRFPQGDCRRARRRRAARPLPHPICVAHLRRRALGLFADRRRACAAGARAVLPLRRRRRGGAPSRRPASVPGSPAADDASAEWVRAHYVAARPERRGRAGRRRATATSRPRSRRRR